jgi:hypothetical protein
MTTTRWWCRTTPGRFLAAADNPTINLTRFQVPESIYGLIDDYFTMENFDAAQI